MPRLFYGIVARDGEADANIEAPSLHFTPPSVHKLPYWSHCLLSMPVLSLIKILSKDHRKSR